MVDRGQTRPLPRPVKPAERMVAQCQRAVAPFNIRTRTLENLREFLGRLVEGALGLGTQWTQGPTRLQQGCAKMGSEFPKRLALAYGGDSGPPVRDRRRV